MDIAARRCVIFIGAGVSKHAHNAGGERPKDWNEFLEHLSSLMDQDKRDEMQQCMREGDLLSTCELAVDGLGNGTFKTELLREYSDKKFEPAQIHDDISRLDSRFVLTTNVDKLYENRANQLQANTVVVKNYYDEDVGDAFRRSQRVVLKVHGTIDSPGKAIFARSHYAKARRDYPHFYRLLRAMFITHTFIFVGASLRDPDIQMILEDHAHRFEGSRPHFIVMPQNVARTGILRVMENTMNLKALLYDAADNHRELGDAISVLADAVEAQREKLTQTMDW